MSELPPTVLFDGDTFEKLYSLRKELTDEIHEVSGAMRDLDTGVWTFPDPNSLTKIKRRLLIRSMFATIEGTTFAFKQYALHTAPEGTLTEAEKALCREVAYALKDNGEAKEETAKLRFASNFKFALRMLAKSHNFSFSIDTNSPGWEAFRNAEKVRNRLMHPKGTDDLTVSDDELGTAIRGFQWAEEQIHRLNNLLWDYLEDGFERRAAWIANARRIIAENEARLKQGNKISEAEMEAFVKKHNKLSEGY